ncbi:MAG: hypothetical protein K9L30_07435 [Desulfobacterales bacterium]|nr:hypothetical protein [Desulfobacterales bacterium]
MNEKEKYNAEINARLTKFGETLNEIKIKQELINDRRPALQVGAVIRKHQEARSKEEELEKADESTWKTIKSEMDGLMNDIDKELKEALAYFG